METERAGAMWAAGVVLALAFAGPAAGDLEEAPQMEGGDIVIQPQFGPDVGEPATPVQPQVQQILSGLQGANVNIKVRDAAEQKLVDLGVNALGVLKSQIGGQKGMARDALAVAVFRLENSPLAPETLLTEWGSRRVNTDPGNIAVHRVAAEELWRLFPHHLFYAVELKAGASAKGSLPRTVVAIAADGKVQPIGDDGSLGNFLKHELAERVENNDRRRAAAGVAILALAREVPAAVPMAGADIVCDGKVDEAGVTGTAFIRGKKVRPVSVVVRFDGEGKVAAVATTQGGDAAAPAGEAATAPATTATAPATRAKPRLPKPQIRGGPEPFVPTER